MAAQRPLPVEGGLVIPGHEIQVSFTRSGGPGGQNVNKVETCAVVRFSVRESTALSTDQRARLEVSLRPRLTTTGEVIVRADRHRERARNEEDGRERLARILAAGLAKPKARKASRPTRASIRRRLDSKRRRSGTKQVRRGGDGRGGDE